MYCSLNRTRSSHLTVRLATKTNNGAERLATKYNDIMVRTSTGISLFSEVHNYALFIHHKFARIGLKRKLSSALPSLEILIVSVEASG